MFFKYGIHWHVLLGCLQEARIHTLCSNVNYLKLLRTSPTLQEIRLSFFFFFFFLFRSVPQNTKHPCELVLCGTERNQHFIPRHTLVCHVMFSSLCPSVRLTVCKLFVCAQYLDYLLTDVIQISHTCALVFGTSCLDAIRLNANIHYDQI